MRKRKLEVGIIAWLTAGVFVMQSSITFAACIEADQRANMSNRPIVKETANHLPLINITSPTAGGVSRNMYSLFNVPGNGAILNNALSMTDTKLAGWINRNPFLQGGAAKVIVNEVTSANPSYINGFLEVAGNKASVVIANPNGISVNGGGFINTANAILTTGRPEYGRGGNLQDFRVERGHVSVEGDGLNGCESDSVSIYTRAAEINADLWANHLNITTGANVINSKTGQATAIATKNDSDKPQVGLDISAVGGMYAGVIELVGTEKGLGVNQAGQIGATKALSLEADGTLHVAGNIYSAGSMNIATDAINNYEGAHITGSDVALNSNVINNGRNVDLEAKLQTEQAKLKELENALEKAYGKDVTAFTSSSQITAYEKDIQAAGVAYDKQLAEVEKVQQELKTHQAGTINAAHSLQITAGTVRNTSGAVMYSGGDMDIEAKSVLNRGAIIEAVQNGRIKADNISNENEAFSLKRVSTKLTVNPRRIRIDQAGHSERGQAFATSEFRELGSGYGAYHNGNAGKIDDYTIIDSMSQTSWETVAINNPAKMAAGENLTLNGSIRNENSWLAAGDTITARGNLQNIAAENQSRTVTFGTTQGSYTYRRKWPHKAKRRGYGSVTFMTPQVELSEPQGVSMPEVTAKHSQADKDLNPFNTASVTAKYAQETNAAYTDKKNFLSSEKMNEERLYDPQTVAGQMAAVSEGRKVYGVTGLISAKNIVVTGDDIDNDGVIMAGKANIKGKYVRNKGIVAGGSLSLDAQGNLTVTGKISGEENVSLTGQKVDIHSTTVNFQTQNTVKQVAGVVSQGTLSVRVEDTLNANGAVLAGNTVTMAAGKDINLATEKLDAQKDMTADSSNYLRTSRTTELTTEIQGKDNVTINAGKDVNARAAYIGSENGDISLTAGHNINLEAGKAASHDQYSLKHKESGLLSSTTTLTQSDTEHETILGTGISGQNITLQAGGNIQTAAVQLATDNNINLAAKNVTLDSAVQYDREQDEKQVKNSGLLASGWGIMIGTEKIKDKASDKYLTQQGTAIGANGKVTIVAAEKAQITSSDISTQQGVEITAPEVSINGKENITESTRIHEEKKSGLTISLGGSSIAAIQSVTQPVKRATDVKDKRLQALYAWRAGRSAKDNKEAFRNMGKGKFDIGINVGFGSSQSKSQTDTVERVYAGSKVIAGETVDIKATEKDLAITGSDVTGKNINLAAKGNIELRAGTNSSHTEVTEKSRDTSISAGYTFGTGFTTGSFSHNQSNMKGQGDTVTHKDTHIAANNRLTTKSGADTNIIGATASGNKVDMTIGENLHIETLQDTDNYHETSHSGGISIGVGKGTKPSFGVNGSRGKIDSTYASTTEQAGIYAGTEGFNIRTENNTHLKGAVIASEAAAEKNKLSTGTLNWENIENKAEYGTKDVGFAYHKHGDFAKKSKKDRDELYKTNGLAPDFGMPAHGKAKNSTKAAIAQGTLEIHEKNQDVRDLSRDTQSALSKLDKIFDKSTIQERQELAKVFGEEAYRLAHKMKGDGSPKKIAVHAIIGGIMSRITGAGFASGSIGAGVNEAVIEEIAKIKDPGTAQVVSSIVGAAAAKIAGGNAVAGGNAAASGTRNNQYGERPRYNGAIIHTKYGFFKVIDGSDVYMEEVPDGIYFWNQDEENSQYGWDFHRKDGVDYYYPNKIEWSIYKNVDGAAYGVVLVRESDYERKLILQKAGKMFIESMIYGSGNEVARDLMEEINNGSINAWNAAKTIFSKYQDIFVEFFKK